MAELSRREHEILDMIFYLRCQLGSLLPENQASELEAFFAAQLDDYEASLTPELVTRLLLEIRKYEPMRARLEKLASQDVMRYPGPAQRPEEAPIIPLGEKVVCHKNGHDGNEPYVTRLRRYGQRCPIHNILLVPLEEKKD